MPNDNSSSENLRPLKRTSSELISTHSSRSKPPGGSLLNQSPQKSSYGILIDEIRDGSKILVPSKSTFIKDPLVEKIQIRLNQLLLENKPGAAVEINGFYSLQLGAAISKLRSSLPNPPCKPGEHVDQYLINYLFPEATRSNLENHLIEIKEKNADQGDFPAIIKELQGRINSLIPEALLLENGLWSNGLLKHLTEYQSINSLKPTGVIDCATYKLLKGAKIRDLVSDGDATLMISTATSPDTASFIRMIQSVLNKYLKFNLKLDGVFSESTADALEIAQKAAAIKERRVFGKESFQALSSLIRNEKYRQRFFIQLTNISICTQIVNALEDKTKSDSLFHKMLDRHSSAGCAENALIQGLAILGISLHSPSGIRDFQRRQRITQDGKINKETSQQIYELLSANWIKEKVSKSGYRWRDGVNELNAIGLRGWSPEIGANENTIDQWNDTIAFVWKDELKNIRFLEYCATTDPGIIERNKNQKAISGDFLPEGQYSYVSGFFHGSAGAAVPVDTTANIIRRNFFDQVLSRLSTFFLGSHPFIIRWIEVSVGVDDIERVGQLAHNCQVPKISKARFRKEISPLFQKDPAGFFLYTLLDLSKKNLEFSDLAS